MAKSDTIDCFVALLRVRRLSRLAGSTVGSRDMYRGHLQQDVDEDEEAQLRYYEGWTGYDAVHPVQPHHVQQASQHQLDHQADDAHGADGAGTAQPVTPTAHAATQATAQTTAASRSSVGRPTWSEILWPSGEADDEGGAAGPQGAPGTSSAVRALSAPCTEAAAPQRSTSISTGCDVQTTVLLAVDLQGGRCRLKRADGPPEWVETRHVCCAEFLAERGEPSWTCRTPSTAHPCSRPTWSTLKMPFVCFCSAKSVRAHPAADARR